jgi:ADP-heptose:LPS heptosyltransferase
MDVLLIRLGGLGDLLVALPSMTYVRRTMPGRRFALLCRGEYGGLFLDAGITDGIVPVEGREASALFADAGFPPSGPRPELSLAVGWMQKPPPPEMEGELKSRGARTVLFTAPTPPHSVSISRRFFAVTESGFPLPDGIVPDFDECSRLRSKKGGMTAARAGLRTDLPSGGRFAVVHPGSGGRAKLWPFVNFLEIARRLADAGIPGVFVTGEAEERPAIAGRLAGGALPHGWTWARRPSILGLAGLLAEAPLYLGNDSGITHLAAACGARVTALFLEENIPAWEPFGRTRVLAARALSNLDAEVVWGALRESGEIY